MFLALLTIKGKENRSGAETILPTVPVNRRHSEDEVRNGQKEQGRKKEPGEKPAMQETSVVAFKL